MVVSRPVPIPRRTARIRVVAGGRRARVWLPPWLVFTALAVVMFFALIYSRVALDHSAFELAGLQREIARAEASREELRMEIARLEAPDRIARTAAELGLVLPSGPPRPLILPPAASGSGD